jgi:diguanylate cyclase (GGDEF)-like protein/PAS domain S-box-containing protein
MRIQLKKFKSASNFRSLSTSIVIAMCTGLLIPALIGISALNYLRQDSTTNEIESYLHDKTVLLANSLALPVWNFDVNSADKIANAMLLDPQVIRITIRDTKREIILNLTHPERRVGTIHSASEKLMLNNELAGFVELDVDDGLMKQKSQRDQVAYTYIFLFQFILALVLILVALHYRVLKPLTTLTDFSHKLADGNFEHAISWQRLDEIGHLATQLDQMRKDLRAAFAEQQAILGNVPAGVIFIRNGIIQLANRHAEEIFGYAKDEMQGLLSKNLYLSAEQFIAIRERALAAMTTTQGGFTEELRLKRQDGSEFWARLQGSNLQPHEPHAGSIWVFEDISKRKAAESEINNLAFYDPLTQLPNRRLLLDRLKQALISSARNKKCGALLFIDLDDFKTLNDTYGHDSGDNLLQQVAQRLLTCVRQDDTVARLGGDEFVILLEDLSKNMDQAAAKAKNVSEKILFALNQCYQIDNHLRYSTPSIGVTLFIDHHESVEELLKRADMAMYEAKAAGRNTVRFFDQKMQDMLMLRAALEDDFRNSILQEEFQLYYQPQILSSGCLAGVEALVRWQHPQRGMVSPADFIPLAEDSGLILPLGHWVLRTACEQIAAWANDPDMSPLIIAVNVSARQFHQTNFVGEVLNILKQTGANPLRLKLELTESMLVNDIEDIILKMSALKTKGVCFSLDDFGTGYSSLSYLKRLPLDQLKIDQSFVKNILNDSNDAAIAKMVIALGLSLNLNVIAEGVELDAQKEYLAHLGCHAYQGYLFSKPLPLDELNSFCRQQNHDKNHQLSSVL